MLLPLHFSFYFLSLASSVVPDGRPTDRPTNTTDGDLAAASAAAAMTHRLKIAAWPICVASKDRESSNERAGEA